VRLLLLLLLHVALLLLLLHPKGQLLHRQARHLRKAAGNHQVAAWHAVGHAWTET
jgi:hypothetical protein